MSKKSVYKLLFSIEAPDVIKSENADKLITQFFQEGELVIGEFYKKENIIVDGRYIIPLDYVEKEDKLPYIKKDSSFNETIDRIKQQSVIINEREKEKLEQIGENIKQQIEGKNQKKLKTETNAIKKGALLGLGVGILTALYFRKNIWTISIVSLSIGGYVALQIVRAKEGNNIVESLN